MAALATIVVLLGGAAGPVPARSRRPLRLPGAAIAAWLGVLAGTLAALTGLVATALFGRPGLGHHVIEWLPHYLKHHEHPSGGTTSLVSVLPPAAAIAFTLVATRRCRRTVARRRRHREALGLVTGPSHDLPDVRLMSVVYCLPERERQIVMSGGALRRLNAAQLRAVLSHERTHLGRRHHLIPTLVDAAGTALAWLPSFRPARDHLPPLTEMVADDEAARRTGPDVVAALRKRALSPYPAGGLARPGRPVRTRAAPGPSRRRHDAAGSACPPAEPNGDRALDHRPGGGPCRLGRRDPALLPSEVRTEGSYTV
ncbi:M48 family metalloprotease [Actinoallomurus acaciae]|uniref:M48 family metalloprotease n=2 Tax=Actinoallomurus acaciae TaxID=502577 RepID=A0ABV5YBJ7_9ACTN